jgi:hypothetical protein
MHGRVEMHRDFEDFNWKGVYSFMLFGMGVLMTMAQLSFGKKIYSDAYNKPSDVKDDRLGL